MKTLRLRPGAPPPVRKIAHALTKGRMELLNLTGLELDLETESEGGAVALAARLPGLTVTVRLAPAEARKLAVALRDAARDAARGGEES